MSVRNILDGTIPVGGGIGEEISVSRIVCQNIEVTSSGKEGAVDTPSIITPELILAGTQVLLPEALNNTEDIALTYSDGSTGTIKALVYSRLCDLNNQQHVLTCQTTLNSLSKSIKQMIIPIQFNFTGRQSKTTGATVAVINNSDLLLGLFTSTWKTIF